MPKGTCQFNIINSQCFPWGNGWGKKQGLIFLWHLPSGIHILPLSLKLEIVSAHETPESTFEKLSLHSALNLCVYLVFLLAVLKILKILCIKMSWGWCPPPPLGTPKLFNYVFHPLTFPHFPPKKQHTFPGHFCNSFILTYLLFTDWDCSFISFFFSLWAIFVSILLDKLHRDGFLVFVAKAKRVTF